MKNFISKKKQKQKLVPKAVLEFLLSSLLTSQQQQEYSQKNLDFVHIFIFVTASCWSWAFLFSRQKMLETSLYKGLEKPSLVQLFLVSLVIKASWSESRKVRKGMRRYYKSRTRQLDLPHTNSVLKD